MLTFHDSSNFIKSCLILCNCQSWIEIGITSLFSFHTIGCWFGEFKTFGSVTCFEITFWTSTFWSTCTLLKISIDNESGFDSYQMQSFWCSWPNRQQLFFQDGFFDQSDTRSLPFSFFPLPRQNMDITHGFVLRYCLHDQLKLHIERCSEMLVDSINPYWQISGVWVGPIPGKLIQQSILEFWGITRANFWKTHPNMDEFSRNRSSSCADILH